MTSGLSLRQFPQSVPELGGSHSLPADQRWELCVCVCVERERESLHLFRQFAFVHFRHRVLQNCKMNILFGQHYCIVYCELATVYIAGTATEHAPIKLCAYYPGVLINQILPYYTITYSQNIHSPLHVWSASKQQSPKKTQKLSQKHGGVPMGTPTHSIVNGKSSQHSVKPAALQLPDESMQWKLISQRE